jgi:hypothetical protein
MLTRQEVISVGFDDFLALTGVPPYSTGLRVPPLVGPTYRFLACVADLTVGDRLRGLRQFAEIASYQTQEQAPSAPVYPEKRPIVTPGWHFVDTAPITWTLTFEPLTTFVRRAGAFDQTSFILRDTTGPALVYETAAFPAFPLLPGYLGLSAYAPPVMRGIKQYVWKDIRYPEQQNEPFTHWRPMTGPTRIRLYVDVQQTDAQSRFAPDFATSFSPGQLAFAPGALVPEELFLQDFPDAIVHSVGGALIFDRAIHLPAVAGGHDERPLS